MIFMVVSVTMMFVDRITVDAEATDDTLISYYRRPSEETVARCRTETCTFQTVDLKFESLVPQASINTDAILENPEAPERVPPMTIDAQANDTNAVQVKKTNKQRQLSEAEKAQWLQAMLSYYTPTLIVNSAELGRLKPSDRAVILFNPATRTQLHASIPWEHNGYNYLFGWIQSIETLSDEPQHSRIRVTVDQTPPSNEWVGMRNGGLWVKTRRSIIEEDKSNTDAVFPARVGLIAWPKMPSSVPVQDIEQLKELGRVVVAVVPASVLDPRCNDSSVADTSCVWVLSDDSVIPLQVSVCKRIGDTVYIDERKVFLDHAIAAKDWRQLSARQRRRPPSLADNVKLVMPKPGTMTSGMVARTNQGQS